MSRKAPEIDLKPAETITFRGLVFLTKSRELRTAEGKAIELRSQSVEVLSTLAARPGQIVSKDALMRAVWPNTFVTEDSLTQCIADIRRALGDDEHVIVETFPKRGYRLNADPSAAAHPNAAAGTQRARTWVSRHSLILAALVLVAAAIGAYYGAETWRAAAVSSSDMPRIAILPFDDMSAGADKGYLSDAVAEGIITELARSKTYAVIARNSSFRYRGKPTDTKQIADELGVDYLLEGSQQKIGNRLKVTAQLLKAHDGSHVWANSYNREIGDLFVVQEEIIRTLAERVGRRIERPLPQSGAARVSALHYHLMGIAEIREDFSAARNKLFRQLNLKAIEEDPNSQFGYIGLAWSYRNDAMFGWNDQESNRDEALKRAAEYADKAILLAPDDAEAHNIRASIHTEAGEVEQALARYDQAIALNPSNPDFLVRSTDVLLYIGRTDEAIDRIKQAMGIDPFYPDDFNWQMGWALWEKNDCAAALAAMRRMSRIPSGAHRMLAGIHACLGNKREARQALAVFLQSTPDESISKERREWEKIWTAPGSLDRWIEQMRFAGLPEE
ncbi:tetratricopeptide repeat protein [Mesorhizobium sp. M3A.F.Ca.ET.080.04.2.1]|uniref:winged helix-turn-helix domain-containing tetratricopeptide repeat protein n=1 Tax=Mesorhizobium sp. M3A.F.Ca.ET.080.04.2.1 TaxID=2493676 RepID=UPI000F75BD2F|nr:winged helix-turn-helix domain-containing protein [Mesorhizobium sp. M3A.F.Ca.ET.080.04.2.1]AZO08774.1 tetratricopeptide repeat protein [Mesorhizobium sp. M3A.F.Ca.ET.080.04.2.1]RWF19968.1 MAG: tetratricopeptide repeat protein [Mesorhizobium sp.]